MTRAWRVSRDPGDAWILVWWDWSRASGGEPVRLSDWELDRVPRDTLVELCEAAFPGLVSAAERTSTEDLRDAVRRGFGNGTLVAVRELPVTSVPVSVAPGPIGDFLRKVKASVFQRDGSAASAAPSGPTKPRVSSGLGNGVDALVAKSPTAQDRLKAFKDREGKVEWGAAGSGSYYDAAANKIVIDGAEKDSPAAAMQSLSHELGHANSPVAVDSSTKDAYVRSMLDDEGEATLSNCEVRAQVLSNGGPDIGVAGQNSQRYKDVYGAYLSHGDRAQARRAVGDAFGSGEITSTTGQPYSQYYGNAYDAMRGPR